jgi:hypothetical protein
MNPLQSGIYLSADIVTRNLQDPIQLLQSQQESQQEQQQQQQLVITDVFDIPDFDTTIRVSVPPPVQLPTVQLPTVQPPTVQLPTVQPQISQSNFINSINRNAMTDVMNQLAIQKQKTPSVNTKQSDVSVPLKPSIPPAMIHAATTCSSSTHKDSSQLAKQNGVTQAVASLKKNKPRSGAMNNKVMVEEEDKDSAIDYDDDDPSIKKIKLSLFHFAKDITFNLIFAIPFLRTKLSAILKEQTLALNQIERIFDEFKDKLNKFELDSIKKYVCEDGIRDKLNFILETGFNKILADGVIDINDAPQFNQLVYFIIKSFNDINHGKVYRFYVSKEHVMLLLHFILKSVFTLTLKGQEEQMAIGLLDTSFKLVQLEVLPLISKRWYHKFSICKGVKDIEDIIE